MKKDAPMSPAARAAVLIVEDEPRMREMLLRFAEESELEAQAVRSAEQAVKHMEQTPPQIVLLDLNLPGMGGIELFQWLRAHHPQAQVIVLTGFGSLEAAKRAIRLDVVDFLTKPCALDDLERAVSRARQRLRSALPDRVPTQPPPPPTTDPPIPRVTLAELERQHILDALDRHHGHRAAAAAELGISERTLYYRLNEYQKST